MLVHDAGPWFWWIRNLPRGKGSQMYTAVERAVSRQLNVPIEDVHRAELECWEGRIIDLELLRRQGDPAAIRRELVDELRAALAR